MKFLLEKGDVIEITTHIQPATDDSYKDIPHSTMGGFLYKDGVPYYTYYTCSIFIGQKKCDYDENWDLKLVDDANAVSVLKCLFDDLNSSTAHDLATALSRYGDGLVTRTTIVPGERGEVCLKTEGREDALTVEELLAEYKRNTTPVLKSEADDENN